MADSLADHDDLDTISLLQAMYPQEDELILSPETERYLADQSSRPDNLEITLRVPLDEHDHPDKRIELVVNLDSVGVKVQPRQPGWLSRSLYADLLDSIPPIEDGIGHSEYILEIIEMVKLKAVDLVLSVPPADTPSLEHEEEEEGEKKLERVWFWFPMLSTREKRKDLVQYAPRYGLTGFVLAGKPALLCLEGEGRKVERYMSDIKSISWGDIPSFQKKVTERFRRPIVSGERAFTTMTDITNEVTHYGQYNHRGDMGDVRRLMEKWGVGDDFGAAVLNSSS